MADEDKDVSVNELPPELRKLIQDAVADAYSRGRDEAGPAKPKEMSQDELIAEHLDRAEASLHGEKTHAPGSHETATHLLAAVREMHKKIVGKSDDKSDDKKSDDKKSDDKSGDSKKKGGD